MQASAGAWWVPGVHASHLPVSPRQAGLGAVGRPLAAQQQQLFRVREQQLQRLQLRQQ